MDCKRKGYTHISLFVLSVCGSAASVEGLIVYTADGAVSADASSDTHESLLNINF